MSPALETAFIIIAYLLGSMSSAIILCKLSGQPDPRDQGSGNPGATNVLRFGGKRLPIFVPIGDTLKGLLPATAAALQDHTSAASPRR